MSKKKKSMPFRCLICSKNVKTEEGLIRHYHKKHPNEAAMLYETLGTTGNAFADQLAHELSGALADANKRFIDLKVKNAALEIKYEDVINKSNVLARAITSIGNTAIIAETAIKAIQAQKD